MTRELIPTPIESKEYEFVLIEGLKKENAELKMLLKEIVMYGNSYKEWLNHYGTNQMTTQKQSFGRLVDKLKNAEKFLGI
jgi:hypothetical protein